MTFDDMGSMRNLGDLYKARKKIEAKGGSERGKGVHFEPASLHSWDSSDSSDEE